MGQHFSDKGLDPGIDRNRAQMFEESTGDSQPVKILLDDERHLGVVRANPDIASRANDNFPIILHHLSLIHISEPTRPY